MTVEYVCERCGSANVTSATIARWDTKQQRWIVVGHYDSSECLDCEDETRIAERLLEK